MSNKVAAIVVTYNRKALLEENLEALLKQSGASCDILVIDNHSTDQTNLMVEKYVIQYPGKVYYFDTGANLGGAGGFCYGINKAVEEGYENIWIMDDDCIPTETSLHELLKAEEKLGGNYGFLSSKVLWKDGSLCSMNVQRHPLTKKVTDFTKELTEVTMASFVSLYVRAEVVREVGLPMKEFFIWTDDWEYTRRISLKYPSYVVTKSEVIHKSASNIPADITSDSLERLDRYWYLYRNDVYLYRREGLVGFWYEFRRIPYLLLKVLFKAKDHKGKRIGKILSGTWAGLFFYPRVEYVGDLTNPYSG